MILDIEGTDTTESSEYDSEDEYGNGFIVDSDVDIYQSSPVPNSGVVIEEIVDDEKPESGDDQNKQLKKKKQVAKLKPKDSKIFKSEIVAKGETDLVENEDEDEDGFPISTAEKDVSISQKEDGETKGEQALKKIENANKKRKDVDDFAGVKRKVDSADEDEPQDGKKKKRNKLKERIKEENADASGNSNETNVIAPDEKHPEAVKTTTGQSGVSHAKDENEGKLSNNEVGAEKKNKNKKKKKTKELEGIAAADQITSSAEKQNLSVASEKKGKKQTETKPSQRSSLWANLMAKELLLEKRLHITYRFFDGCIGMVSVKYIGKLQKDGKIFDSNVGRAPFKFRLGVGQVIKGWEVGINGMRIGDKRRITIPPSMGYADKGVGTIPPNAWLVFDVELVDVDR
ncbi:hypothetical protein V8G54_006784 [Vigna mungo]|uniref:peptidylprolyl isomerase n=1 Tax=Vigna mungo TaxID=3915 RepID=A0AAQ3P2T6_VIGMU